MKSKISCHLRRKRKAQMEIMGLAIIVILISLGMLFVIRFVIFQKPSDVGLRYRSSELAANFLNTLLETNAPDCSNTKFMTLFQDCAENKGHPEMQINCGPYGESCAYISSVLGDILDGTFDEWKVKYYFITTTDSDSYLDPGNNVIPYVYPGSSLGGDDTLTEVCPGDRRAKSQPLPSNPPIDVMLFLC